MVVFSPLVEDDLLKLVDILINEGYLYSYPFAVKYVDGLIEYVENHIEQRVSRPAPSFFSKYGSDLKYITYNSTHDTTWYILFEVHGDVFFVKYITNNKFEGQYFNV